MQPHALDETPGADPYYIFKHYLDGGMDGAYEFDKNSMKIHLKDSWINKQAEQGTTDFQKEVHDKWLNAKKASELSADIAAKKKGQKG